MCVRARQKRGQVRQLRAAVLQLAFSLYSTSVALAHDSLSIYGLPLRRTLIWRPIHGPNIAWRQTLTDRCSVR